MRPERATVVLEKDGKFLLIRKTGKKTDHPEHEGRIGVWEFPGGTLDYGETIEDAAVRECEEECGIRPRNAKYVRTWLRNVDEEAEWRNVYFFKSSDFDDSVQLSDEHDEFRWLSREDILDLNKNEMVGIDTLVYLECFD